MVRVRASDLRDQLEALQATVAALQTRAADHVSSRTARVPSDMPKFRGKADDVRQWIFLIENARRLHGHAVIDTNTDLPDIAAMAMQDQAASWYLFWVSSTPIGRRPKHLATEIENCFRSSRHELRRAPGTDRMYLQLRRDWYWSRMVPSIQKFTNDCEPCRRNKPRLLKTPELLVPLKIPNQRWSEISMDQHGSSEVCSRFRRDLGSLRSLDETHPFYPNSQDYQGRGCGEIVRRTHLKVARHACQHRLRSRHKVYIDLLASVVRVRRCQAEHDETPEPNTGIIPSNFHLSKPKWLDLHLPNAEFAINSTVNSSIEMTPFEADLGYLPANPFSISASQLRAPNSSKRLAIKFRDRQSGLLRQCQDALAAAQERMRDVYNSDREDQTFQVIDKVYLSTKFIDNKHTGLLNSSKLGLKWIGPYTAVRKVHNYAYELNIFRRTILHSVFNIGSLKPYAPKTQLSRPAGVILGDESVGQIVSAILGKRKRRGAIQCHVRWEGEEEPTWNMSTTWTKSQI